MVDEEKREGLQWKAKAPWVRGRGRALGMGGRIREQKKFPTGAGEVI
jgi:hypothetical protein